MTLRQLFSVNWLELPVTDLAALGVLVVLLPCIIFLVVLKLLDLSNR